MENPEWEPVLEERGGAGFSDLWLVAVACRQQG